LDHLQLPRTYLFGSSFGATIALKAASEHPDRFARMVLQGGFARRSVERWEQVLCQFARYAPGRMKHLVIGTSLKSPGDFAIMSKLPKERRRFMLSNCGNAPIAASAQIALLIAQLDLRPLLGGVTLPVRLIGGDRDGIVPRACEEEVLRGLPMAERIEIDGCGHLPQYTHPGLLAELIRQFFTPECGRVPHDGCSAH
jgi:pimeloyl-ACP methyl ester carboxylesterase